MGKLKYNIGDIIEDLEIINYDKEKEKYKLKCIKCGRIKYLNGSTISRHHGTNHKACGKGLKTKDKDFYSRWQNMRVRTQSDNYHATDQYKGRGINSDEFENFIDFYDAMYESFLEHSKIYGKKNTSLDRIDVNKSYSKENCRWITLEEQKGNMQNTIKFKATDPNGNIYIDKNLAGFCKKYNLSDSTARDCLNGRLKLCKGWKFERI